MEALKPVLSRPGEVASTQRHQPACGAGLSKQPKEVGIGVFSPMFVVPQRASLWDKSSFEIFEDLPHVNLESDAPKKTVHVTMLRPQSNLKLLALKDPFWASGKPFPGDFPSLALRTEAVPAGFPEPLACQPRPKSRGLAIWLLLRR